MNALPDSFPFRDVFSEFVKEYTSCTTYWYVPKARAVNDENIQVMREILRTVFDGFLDRIWTRDTQDELLHRLIEKGIVDPYRQGTLQDRTALSRIIAVLLEILGLLWIKPNEEIIITDAGFEIILEDNPRPIIEGQIAKIQYPNPSLTTGYAGAFGGLLPHLFLLQLLQRVDYYLTVTEYDLFVNLAQSQDDLSHILRYIDCWRDLNSAERSLVLDVVRDIPMRESGEDQPALPSEEDMAYPPSSDHSRYGRIHRNSPYQRSLYIYPHYLTHGRVDSERTIACTSPGQIDQLVREKLVGLKIPTFKAREDWFAYFGDPKQQPSWFTYLTLEIAKAATVAEAKQLVEEHQAELTPDETEEIERLQVEKGIESFYAERLHLLEEGLQLVEGGRQYSTPIGRIDFLCKSKTSEYVVVEIKANEAGDSVFGQTLRYIGWVHRNIENGRYNVRGIILAGRFPETARYSRIGLLKENYQQFLAFKEHGLYAQTT